MFNEGKFIILQTEQPYFSLFFELKSKILKYDLENCPNIDDLKQTINDLKKEHNLVLITSNELSKQLNCICDFEVKVKQPTNNFSLKKPRQITLIASCMRASKSKIIIDRFYDNEKEVDAFKPMVDTRDGDFIKSRAYSDEKTIPCLRVNNPEEMLKSTKPIIIIDEFQFFDADLLKDTVLNLKEQGKSIIIAGLDLLASGEEWPAYRAIKEISDVEIKPKARCQICEKPASFTSLVKGQKNKSVQVESEQTVYEPRCKEHFTH
ncbi:MAG TPA: hypothetical protein VLL98_01710 [Rickettsiales bacterium]|nr:hypothetical protein [Rickettsiales bacterium]